ncbi:hypothetical protein [Fischerella sp. PCC 9605]|jgi:hypothetical protein|uniref:hypothetical protein n=1 Tax=Fischerella sp. PCC 9605 TaxID=1173024 RepID=UPI00047E7E57|nr:hypothetical protein [Fischerella sp. PCC 9605]
MFRKNESLKKKNIGGILTAASLVIFSGGLVSCNFGFGNPAEERQEQQEQSDDDENEGSYRDQREDSEDEDDDKD